MGRQIQWDTEAQRPLPVVSASSPRRIDFEGITLPTTPVTYIIETVARKRKKLQPMSQAERDLMSYIIATEKPRPSKYHII